MVEQPRRVDLGAEAYDERWERLAASGAAVHGEADLVERLLATMPEAPPRARVLDAGCGTGRVAIRLAERGLDAVGVDLDPALLDRARAKAPQVPWHRADLAALAPDDVPGPFDAVVMAGNVMIFVAPGTAAAVVANLAARLHPGGVLVAGFQLLPGRLSLGTYDACVAAAGLTPVARYATWDGARFTGGDYVVAVDATPPPASSPASTAPS